MSKPSSGVKRRTFLKQVATATTLGSIHPGAEAQVPSSVPITGAIRFPRVFAGKELAMIAFPLGGIGTGSISLGGRGQLRDWEIFNRPQKGFAPRYTFASIWVKASTAEPVTCVLEARHLPPYEGDSGIGWADAPGMPRLRTASFTGEFPFAVVDFKDETLPVRVSLEAFTPFVPLDPEASSLPLAILRYRVRNDSSSALNFAIAFNVDNPVGKAGRVNEYRESSLFKGILMHNPGLNEGDNRKGSFALTVVNGSGEISYVTAWDRFTWALPLEDFWRDFSANGRLSRDCCDSGLPHYETKNAAGLIQVGSVSASNSLEPGEEKDVTFLLTWHFPNRTPEVCGWDAPEGEEKTIIGNHYCGRFSDAWDVAQYVAPRLRDLEGRSREFLNSLKETSLPGAVLDAALSNLSTLRTNTCFQTSDGRFHGFEGCKEKGCCSGSCTHVWNYESVLTSLFPSLTRSLLDSWFGFCTNEEGLMDFRYYLPFWKKALRLCRRRRADGKSDPTLLVLEALR